MQKARSGHMWMTYRCRPSIFLRGEDSQHIIIFMNRFSVVSTLLLIPILPEGIAELALDCWWIGITTVQAGVEDIDVGAGVELRCR